MRRRILRLAGLALAASLAVPPAQSADRTLVDGAGRSVTIGTAERVVVIGGALTEIAYSLGVSARIAAVDTTSLYPPSALAEKPNVGYMRALSAEGVLALHPDLVLAVEGSGPPPAMDVLKAASVPIFIVPDGHSPEGIGTKIAMVAEVFERQEQARALAASVAADFAVVRQGVGALKQRKKVLFVLSLAGGRVLAAGRNTAADALIVLAGAENAMAGFDGYKQVSEEAIVSAAPEAILVMKDGAQPLGPDQVFAVPAIAATPAAGKRSLVIIDGLSALGFGPRTATAVRDLAAQLYPDLALARLPSEGARP